MEYQFRVDTKFSFIPPYPSFIIGVHNYIENSLKFGLYKSEKSNISIIPTFGTSFDFLIIIFGTPSISLNTGVRFIFSHKIKENFSIYYGFPVNTTFNMSQLASWIRYRYPAPFRIENNPEYRYVIIEDKFYLPTIESGFSFGFEIRKKNFFVRNEIFIGICAMSTYLKYINVEKETLFGIKREGYEFFYPVIIGGYSVIIGGRSD